MILISPIRIVGLERKRLSLHVMLCGIYLPSVVYNFVVMASLEANQNRPKIQHYGNKQNKFYILSTLKFKTIILICVHTKTSKFHKPSVEQGLKIFILV